MLNVQSKFQHLFNISMSNLVSKSHCLLNLEILTPVRMSQPQKGTSPRYLYLAFSVTGLLLRRLHHAQS